MILSKKQNLLILTALCGMLIFFMHDNSSPKVSAEVNLNPEIIYQPDAVPTQTVSTSGKYEYIEITDSCTSYLKERCIPVYSGPGIEYEKIYELHNGMILKVKDRVVKNGQTWYLVYFDEWLRYPGRVEGDWYVPAVSGRIIRDDGEKVLTNSEKTTSKRIVVDLSEHMIYAYDGNIEFLRTKVSTGVELTPTPTGTFTIFKKTPSRYMQGPLPGVTDTPFDLPGVPWNMYFTNDGAVIHGSYWHDRYGTDQSSGCINLPPELAKVLYDWADLGTTVTIQN